MGRAIVAGGKPAMEAPSVGIALADIAEGSVVYLNEKWFSRRVLCSLP